MTNNAFNSNEIMGLTKTHLVAVGNDHFLHHKIAAAFYTMQNAAIQAGVDMQICSSFRSFEQQLSIWNRKWSGDLPLNTLQNTQLSANELNDIEKIHAIMLWSALPGASRHHWGTDFDIFDKRAVEQSQHKLAIVPSEYEHNGPCAALSNWIEKNAEQFGFYLPYAKYVGGVAKEPWHISNKKIAKNIQKHFQLDDLYAQLEQADILGKETILKLLPALVKQYTFNQGP